MLLSGNQHFVLHPTLARFVEQARRIGLPAGLAPSGPLGSLADYCILTILPRSKPSAAGQEAPLTLLGPLLPILAWPQPLSPPVGLPMQSLALSTPELERLLCAELLRQLPLAPTGPLPEWTRRLFNAALDPAGRQRLFGQTKRLSQHRYGQWLGMSREQLAHQARLLAQPDSPTPVSVSDPNYYQEWVASLA
ncbi:hypothetical protein [Aeromonas caviae]